jgi:poly(ADP-ribose) glycohydrolase ARH3
MSTTGSYGDPRDRARGALLGTFVGDALGMAWEGAPPEAIPERVEMREARLGKGTYTDDTEMMIALAESLLERGTIDADELGRAFLAAYDPRRGYGAGTRQVLDLIASGIRPAEAARAVFAGQGSLGNGAAMRIAPVAVRFAQEPDRLRAEAERSARSTHAHPLGVDAAQAQAAAIAAALRGDDPLVAAREAAASDELRQRLDAATALSNAEPSVAAAALGNSSAAHESVPTAIYAATAHPTFDQAVGYAVRCGGDTDTIAAMTGAIAGARHGASSIPGRWLDALEEGDKGRTYVIELANRLIRSA